MTQRIRTAILQVYQSKTAFIGFLLIVALFLAGALAPILVFHDPLEMHYTKRLAPPGKESLLGTDQFGRDLLSRILWGARRALLLSLAVVILGLIMGIPAGALPGYYGGIFDNLAMRFIDAWLAFPGILFFLALLAALGPGLSTLILALSVGSVPSTARLVRGLVLAEKEKEYIEAARAIGERDSFILFRQILPNIISPIIVMATVSLGNVVLIASALSFLGLGELPPAPSWGLMLSEARNFIETSPLLAIIPGTAISLSVLGFNLFGDGLRDLLDPRLSEE
jgi:ABC-type dipeptide/oligopeptide/nickel transport system permease subunit